ncbi:MAG: hypothetical protein EPO24_09985 [Bacteroidetes bacterium]|nr:MAG: hypothetical protein EPO24_09985 [Bacteroidota bacterium]
MSRSKFSQRFCGYCNKTTRMELMGEMTTTPDKAWCRCTRCHHMTLINAREALQAESGIALDAAKATTYTPELTFKIGEAIFHSEWNDVGKVLSKVRTSSGSQAIIVSFEKEGQKTLIENLR